MKLIKTSLLNGIAVFIKILTLLGLNKILAIYVGPGGYAALGQFQNAVQLITSFASGAITTGVTKYTAEFYDKPLQQHRLWQTSGTIALSATLITSVLLFIFNKNLALWFLKDEKLSSVFSWFALTLIFFAFNNLLLAILNGKKEIGRYVIATIAGSLFSFIVTTFMAIKLGLYGALLGLAIYQSLSFFISFWLCWQAPWFKLAYLVGVIDKLVAKDLFKYALMALVTAVCVPASQILVRHYLATTLGWDAAGFWEAMWRLSSTYLMLVTTTLSVYYLPRLAELKESGEIKAEILSCYKVVLPATICCSLLIYNCRYFIISLLFTNNFIAMETLFGWQLVGDTIKIASWLLGYIYVAKGFVRLYIFSEIFFSFLFFFLVVLLESRFNLKAVAIAYALNYLMHFSFVFYSLRLARVI